MKHSRLNILPRVVLILLAVFGIASCTSGGYYGSGYDSYYYDRSPHYYDRDFGYLDDNREHERFHHREFRRHERFHHDRLY